jgi:hypothetical protein
LIHYLIEYIFLAILGFVLLFIARGIYGIAYKSEKKSSRLKITLWGFTLVFICPFLYLTFFLIHGDVREYEHRLDVSSIRYGFINKSGKVIIPFRFNSAGPFENGYALVVIDSNVFWIDSMGNKAKNQNVHYLKISDKRDINDRIMTECTTEEYEKHANGEIKMVDTTSEGLCVMRYLKHKYINNKGYPYLHYLYGYSDTTGKLVIPFSFLAAYSFREGLAIVADTIGSNGEVKMGYIDHKGHYCIPLIYEYAEDFSEGKAAVSKIIRE